MGFEVILVNAPPVTGVEDPKEAQATFFYQIGYHAPNYDPRTSARNLYESVPFRIFSDYFIRQPDVPHKVDDISSKLKTTIATVYRHLNKIKRYDILDDVELEVRGRAKPTKGYFLRYGDFPMAWRFTETHMTACLDNYRALVDSVNEIHGRRDKGRKGGEAAVDDADDAEGKPRPRGGPAFRLKLVDTIVDPDEDEDHDLQFLQAVDYLSPRGTFGKSEKEIRKGVGYRLFMECFMERSDRLWGYDELCTALDTTFPTVARYLNKLKALDLLYETTLDRGPDEQPKKAYRLRYGDLSRAWGFTEAQAKSGMRSYRRSVDHIAALCRE